jgi:hypothetical protein
MERRKREEKVKNDMERKDTGEKTERYMDQIM